MKILAIDPGTKCGWCVKDGDRLISGTWNLSKQRHEGGNMRTVRFRGYLNELQRDLGPFTAVVYEEVRRHLGVDAAHLYGAMIDRLHEFCADNMLDYMGIPVGTVKKFATGKGNADKAKMKTAASDRWAGWDGDDNEADARWMAECGASILANTERKAQPCSGK